jgi:hypothetical protein
MEVRARYEHVSYQTEIYILIVAGYLYLIFGIIFFGLFRGSFAAPLTSLYNIIFLNSLSLRDIFLLARSCEDATETIKQFYDWKHKALSFAIKSILTFLLGNVALVIKLFYDAVSNTKVTENTILLFGRVPDLQVILVVISSLIIIIEFFMIIKLRRIPQEYVDAVTIYNAMR